MTVQAVKLHDQGAWFVSIDNLQHVIGPFPDELDARAAAGALSAMRHLKATVLRTGDTTVCHLKFGLTARHEFLQDSEPPPPPREPQTFVEDLREEPLQLQDKPDHHLGLEDSLDIICSFCHQRRSPADSCYMVEMKILSPAPDGCVIKDLHEPIPEREET